MTDYSSHTFTTLSQTLHRIFQQLSTHLHHASTNSSTSFNKMNEYRFSFTAYSTNYDTFLHQYFITNIHNRRVGYRSFIASSSWLSDRSLTTYSNGYSLYSFNKLSQQLHQQTLTITLSQNFQNNLWYSSSLYIFQRTSVSFVNVRIVHTSYHKTFITLQQTMKQFFITKLSKQSSLISSC